MNWNALVLRIDFFEAHFKVHYTKGFRATYPIPLPTTVAGMFAGMLGLAQSDASKSFQRYKFGAALINEPAETMEQSTLLQFGKKVLKTVHMHLMVNPSYYIAIASADRKDLLAIQKNIENQIVYYPFGGQNDFFAKNWSVVGIEEVYNTNHVGNYVYAGDVREIESDTVIQVLPVMHKLGDHEEFFFVLKGRVIANKEMPACEVKGKIITLYKLEDFYPVGAWSHAF
jgi:CRISPR-associated Cas5-like protein